MLEITKPDYELLRRHGEDTYPYECCGVLLGEFRNGDRAVKQVVRCINVRGDRPNDRYQIDGKELLAIQKQARKQEMDIIGFYHSHPDHPARWSPTDLAEAHWPGCSYVITAVEKGAARETNSFVLTQLDQDNKRLEDETMHIVIGEGEPAWR